MTTAPAIEHTVKSSRVLICAPNRRDTDLLSKLLAGAGLRSDTCPDPNTLGQRLRNDALALLITEEALVPAVVKAIRAFIDDQPFWSDFPIVVFTGPDSDARYLERLDEFGSRSNVTIVDRPVRMKSVISIMQSVARARTRQFEIRDLLAKLEDRIAERDRFLAILGHELRNPLAAIVLAAQLADHDGMLPAEHAERIERQAQHLASLVDDLLDLSRITTGKIVLKRSVFDLSHVIAECVKSMQADAGRREIRLTFQPAAEPLVVHADELRVEQIISNLVTNALKYTRRGGHVHVCTERRGEEAAIVVSDSGVGIARERIDTIFELFSQAENAIGRSQGGMGIGLNIVRTLASMHGGSVGAKSDGIEKGSTFTALLPLSSEHVAPPSRAPRANADGDVALVPSRRIVIVDDNADIRDLLQIKLKKLGHAVETAGDGHAGLERISETHPDIAIIDIGMPGMDGYEVAKRVRAILENGILLIALTGFGQADDRDRAAAAGFDEHLTKPIRVEEL
ncbi:MAG TPA: hybrid sensor histidine kinase/response regulator, partial [Thermoanaerobaculia bacterium]|nr:hybrid sensor histidine kinase/response regulator [Thermoanaerobaculia bacterium]